MERLRRHGRRLSQAVAQRLRPGAPSGEAGENRLTLVTAQTGRDGTAQAGNVQVISGASVQTFPMAGMRLHDARTLLNTILRLDSRGPVLVNGRPVSGTYRLGADDVVEFVHHAGEKGVVQARPD